MENMHAYVMVLRVKIATINERDLAVTPYIN